MSHGSGETMTIASPIEVHAHLREPGNEAAETIESGTVAALRGGYQAVMDMPNNPGRPTLSEERVDEKIKIAEETSHTDIGFYAGVDFDNPELDPDRIARLMRKTMGVKFYMGFTTGNAAERTLDDVRPFADVWMAVAKELGLRAPILLHAKGQSGAETAEYIVSNGHAAHWCHLSSSEEVWRATELLRIFPDRFSSEVSLHHLTMTDRDARFKYGWNGGRMQPPLGGEPDADALYEAFVSGNIPILATDHAPHTEDKKLQTERENPDGINTPDETTCYGVTGIEFVLPIIARLITQKARRGHTQLTWERAERALHTEPARMLGVRSPWLVDGKTTLELGPRIIGESDFASKSRNAPYLGWTAGAQVVAVSKHGRTVNLRDGVEKVSRPEVWQAQEK
jgi:dihydroorotase